MSFKNRAFLLERMDAEKLLSTLFENLKMTHSWMRRCHVKMISASIFLGAYNILRSMLMSYR